MKFPQLYYAKSSAFPNEIAFSISFVMTLEPPLPKDKFHIYDNEDIESTQLSAPEDFHFVFLLDRSDSMENYDRIEKAKKALELFIRSLPIGCTFSIVSYGSHYELLFVDKISII